MSLNKNQSMDDSLDVKAEQLFKFVKPGVKHTCRKWSTARIETESENEPKERRKTQILFKNITQTVGHPRKVSSVRLKCKSSHSMPPTVQSGKLIETHHEKEQSKVSSTNFTNRHSNECDSKDTGSRSKKLQGQRNGHFAFPFESHHPESIINSGPPSGGATLDVESPVQIDQYVKERVTRVRYVPSTENVRAKIIPCKPGRVTRMTYKPSNTHMDNVPPHIKVVPLLSSSEESIVTPTTCPADRADALLEVDYPVSASSMSDVALQD